MALFLPESLVDHLSRKKGNGSPPPTETSNLLSGDNNNSNNSKDKSSIFDRVKLFLRPCWVSVREFATKMSERLSPSVDSSSPLLCDPRSRRERVYEFLEGRTKAGFLYEWFTIWLIVANVVSLIVGTLFVDQADYNLRCGDWCDAIFFGNRSDNALGFLNLGSTSILELVTVFVFSVDYGFRFWTADLESPKFAGVWGRVRFIPSFYSMIDLISTVPFYVDSFFLKDTDLLGSQFLRMFRLLRMMRVEGRYDTALTMFDDVIKEQRGIMGTALFIGATTWITVSSLYYLVEHRSHEMIYCGFAYCDNKDDVDTSLCVIDDWGIVDCSAAGCPPTDDQPEPCYNLYRSIPSASYYALLNLFGEFPLGTKHNLGGKIVGTFTAILACAVFALPVGIVGNGFETVIERKREAEAEELRRGESEQEPAIETNTSEVTKGFVADGTTVRGKAYNLMFNLTFASSRCFDYLVDLAIVAASFCFMIGTLRGLTDATYATVNAILFNLVIFLSFEYALRVYSVKEDPLYRDAPNFFVGRLVYIRTFFCQLDVLSVLFYWIWLATVSFHPSNMVKSLLLLRLFRFERYTNAFKSFDDIIRKNSDVLTVTGFTAVLFWVLFAAILYLTERNSPDEEMRSNYKTLPDSMWMTLLNLSGESPLSNYSVYGKIITGIMGLFATGIFGIPIGVLGAGFEEVVEKQEGEEDEENETETTAYDTSSALPWQRQCYEFVNGLGSKVAMHFELSIYALIVLSVGVGIWQTVEGHEDDLSWIEWLSMVVFTVEYTLRFLGVPADPESPSRLYFVFSFYSIVDLLAILPFYLAFFIPWMNEHADFFRMVRMIRLVKLDKYLPSITLIDDVFRNKRDALVVAGYASATLWVILGAFLFASENGDSYNNLDPLPLYGCNQNCTMQDRFQTFFDSMVYTGIHLTGDFPIITYSWPSRFVCFVMVIAAVGVVSIPSGLVASGFSEIVESKSKEETGDDWYDLRYAELADQDPPTSAWGPKVDRWQQIIQEYVNGVVVVDERGREIISRTTFSMASHIFFFAVIVLSVVAVVAESIPEVDRAVGNKSFNFFDVFNVFSVVVFTVEYALLLFCAPKNRKALYSPLVYATTFFGIVDLLSIAPFYIELVLKMFGVVMSGDVTRCFRILRIVRILQLEDFIEAFSKLDNVFRASTSVLKATALLALIIWVGCAALFFIFEKNNPNWRTCVDSVPVVSGDTPGCFDFDSTSACNDYYGEGKCSQYAFTNVPNSMYYVAVFLGGEWAVTDFTWPGRFVCLFLCVAGIGLYAIPVGALFDSFGAVLGLVEEDDEEEEEEDQSSRVHNDGLYQSVGTDEKKRY